MQTSLRSLARTIPSAALAIALAACEGPSDAADADVTDARTTRDGGEVLDGSTPTIDAGTLEADTAVPSGSVPMFVAVGWGGRRVSSCDLGRTWIADQQEAPEDEDDWHRPYTPKGLAYGDGRFVFLTGWGNPSSVHVSTDGVSWDTQVLDTPYGAVGWSDGRFVLVGNRHLAASDDGGATWAELVAEPVPAYDRAGGAFDGVWAAGADGMVQTFRPGVDDDWRVMDGCTGTRHGHIGFEGGFAMGGGVLVSIGHDGDTCTLDVASGAALGAGNVGGEASRRPIYEGGAFHTAGGGQIHSSADGRTWTSRSLGPGVSFELIARSDSATWVGVSTSGDRFFYSDDGETWEEGTGPSGNGLLYLAFGRVSPSSACPASE